MSRSDGRRIRTLDPITRFMGYIMKHRWDSCNQVTWELDYEKVEAYIKARKGQGGPPISLMAVIIAAYVRTCSQFPFINRFLVNKRLYAHNDVTVSFVALKSDWDGVGDQPEALVKIHFTGAETLDEVAEKLNAAITLNRADDANSVEKIADRILKLPGLPSSIVGTLVWCEKHGMLPKALIEASPFHCSMFFTNLASIRGPMLYHHLYEFGTCSTFLALGFSTTRPKSFALGVTLDERITNGAGFIRASRYMEQTIAHPERLETPPAEVKRDID
ncbi:MAG: hypothetical protein FWF45_00925 [Coriobacteriia bacterium]|nr:hypothetical protein [Coriobacteriia bacterium]